MRKKLIAAMTAAVTLANCFVFNVSAAGGVNLALEYKTDALSAGDTVEVAVRMSNNTGLSGWRVFVGYAKDTFEYVDFKPGVFGSELTFASLEEYEACPFAIAFTNLDEMKDVTANGIVGTVTFKVKEGAAQGNYSFWLNYNPEDFFKVGEPTATVEVSGVTGPTEGIPVGHSHNYTILQSYTVPTGSAKGKAVYACTCGDTVEREVIFRGDVNGDGYIDLSDYSDLAKYMSEWPGVTIDEEGADVDGNGTVDLNDLSSLAKYIADWVGYDQLIVPIA